VHIDYHIEYDKHYYSVPHHLVKEQIEVHATSTLVASHPRSAIQAGHSTLTEHMPQAHREIPKMGVRYWLIYQCCC